MLKDLNQSNSGLLFGLETNFDNSQIVLMDVPWEVTTSYGAGASLGSQAVLEASTQLDIFDIKLGLFAKFGIHLDQFSPDIKKLNDEMKSVAQNVITEWDEKGELSSESKSLLKKINQASEGINEKVYRRAKEVLKSGKIPCVLGGDHSTPFGLIKALGEEHGGSFGILHIDAHADLRNSYQGFNHSHASIMNNVLQLNDAPSKLIQVGIRDFCKEEWDMISQNESVFTYFDRNLKEEQFEGKHWTELIDEIVHRLPEKVYISFDIDGLSPEFCPNTGTPVPGGLSFDQAISLIEKVGLSGKQIIGFDLVEVAPSKNPEDQWDGNVGARLLFQLAGWTLFTNGHRAH